MVIWFFLLLPFVRQLPNRLQRHITWRCGSSGSSRFGVSFVSLQLHRFTHIYRRIPVLHIYCAIHKYTNRHSTIATSDLFSPSPSLPLPLSLPLSSMSDIYLESLPITFDVSANGASAYYYYYCYPIPNHLRALTSSPLPIFSPSPSSSSSSSLSEITTLRLSFHLLIISFAFLAILFAHFSLRCKTQ